MIEIIESAPSIDVQQAEFTRLLGYPRGWVLSGRANELAEAAREWYARYGHPWVYAREAGALHVGDQFVEIEGVSFSSTRLRSTLQAAGAHSAMLVAASAGPELEREAEVRWRDEKPDEYFFLEVYGSAVVEYLVTMTGARLCAAADGDGIAVLPHYSPGYPEWTIDEQPDLLSVLRRPRPLAVRLEVLESGMLRPKKSLLAVFGLTRHAGRVRPLSQLSPCENCSYIGCHYRRSPYRRIQQAADPELRASAAAATDDLPLVRDAAYTVSVKALERWSAERLSLAVRSDGSIEALFQYDGTTCTNMGRPLRFHYHVTLGSRQDGYPIRGQSCNPAPGDEGHTSMCRYISDREGLMASIAHERPLLGEPLDAVVGWARPSSPAGCYCDADSRQHKWGLVLETIHYTLAHRPERATGPGRSHTERS